MYLHWFIGIVSSVPWERAGIPIPKNFSSQQTEITHVHAMSNFYSFVFFLGSTCAPSQYLTLDSLYSVANPQTALESSFRPFPYRIIGGLDNIIFLWREVLNKYTPYYASVVNTSNSQMRMSQFYFADITWGLADLSDFPLTLHLAEDCSSWIGFCLMCSYLKILSNVL